MGSPSTGTHNLWDLIPCCPNLSITLFIDVITQDSTSPNMFASKTEYNKSCFSCDNYHRCWYPLTLFVPSQYAYIYDLPLKIMFLIPEVSSNSFKLPHHSKWLVFTLLQRTFNSLQAVKCWKLHFFIPFHLSCESYLSSF